MCNAAMMKSQSSIFSPVIGLIQSCALFQAGHHAQHPPCTGFARHRRVQIANGYINGLDWYFVLYETAVNVHNNGQWNRPLSNPEKEVLEHNSTSTYKYILVHTSIYFNVLNSFMLILVYTSMYH